MKDLKMKPDLAYALVELTVERDVSFRRTRREVMARSPFGWAYPAGAEHDPAAPYNQVDPPDECPECGEPNTDDDGDQLHDGVFCSPGCEQSWGEP